MKLVIFEPYGPVIIPIERLPSAKLISEDLGDFWLEHEDVSERPGCYVFGIRTGRAVIPYYVGMTTDCFQNECFTDHKLNHYQWVIGEYSRGTPVMSFIVHPKRKGKTNIKAIKELENFLIQAGMAVNPALRNIIGRVEPRWGIKGVIRGGQGAPSAAAKEFGSMMGIGK